VSLAPGTRLGPYEITALVGAGGMGEVYRARDTRLDRVVAIKMLRDHLSNDPDRRMRFEREARVISQLNHPHICALFDVGRENGADYLVIEYLDGQTLADRLRKGPLPIEQALEFAIQIAEALDAAHRKGIIHRDLKPANVMLTKTGAKLLDFGIARITPAAGTEGSRDGTLTAEGALLGTPQYMTPEQLEGREADARSDLFAFGAVLYEMLTGRRAFAGESLSRVTAAVLDSQPIPVSRIEPRVPAVLERVVTTCLAKDPDERWQSAGDLGRELRWIRDSDVRGPSAAPPRGRRDRLVWALVTVLAIALTAALVAVFAFLRQPALDTRVYRSTFVPPAELSTQALGQIAVSPDGRYLVFVAPDANPRLWVRPLDSLAAQPLAGTEGAASPFWSPDGRFVAFFANNKLKRIDVSGGPPLILCDASPAGTNPSCCAKTGTWSRNDVIVFSSIPLPGGPALFRVPAAGGTPSAVTMLDNNAGEIGHYFPYFLPDGRHFLYTAAEGGPPVRVVTYVGSLDSGDRRQLLEGSSNVQYALGHLVFLQGTTLTAQPFDPKRLTLRGEREPLAQQVGMSSYFNTRVQGGTFAVSQTSVLIYQAGALSRGSQLIWFDRTGKQIGVLGDRAAYGSEVNLSRDGTHASVIMSESSTGYDVRVFDVMRGIHNRLTFGPGVVRGPIWSPDGQHVVFAGGIVPRLDLHEKAATGAGDERVLLADPFVKFPESWSSDGRFVLYFRPGQAPPPNTVWVLPLFGDRKSFPLLQTPARRSQFSPDGHWVAYESNESGVPDVNVVPFNGSTATGTGRWQVSRGGGHDPRWSRDGKELFYLARNTLMAARVKTDEKGFEVGAVRRLFDLRVPFGDAVYDVSPDGRFLVNTVQEQVERAPITIVVNWTAGLRQ
jgi:Tol biopolymer transport system component